MRYRICGVDRQTGTPVQPIVVEAATERDALVEAGRRGMFTESIEPYTAPKPTNATPGTRPAVAQTMLVECPACKKRFSETADACPKCGFKVDAAAKASLRAKAIQESIKEKRSNHLIGAIVCLVASVLCLFVSLIVFSESQGSYVSPGPVRQREAYEKFLRGERLSDMDVDDLANRERYISTEESGAAGLLCVGCSIVFFVFGIGMLIHLHATPNDPASQSS
ncbi:MAG: hypothetical protein IH830_10790 [Planctomycetes bacterium]|nr:hypothetical protein [Planctomycetota bacterium]